MLKRQRSIAGHMGRWSLWGVVWVLWLTPGAVQAQSTSKTASAEAEADQAQPPAPKAWAEGHRWARAGLDESVSRLEVTPSGAVLALTRDGAVWRWGAESSWRLVLSRPGASLDDPDEIDEEALLLDAESLIGDQEGFRDQGRSQVEQEDGADGDDVEQESVDVAPAQVDGAEEVLIQEGLQVKKGVAAGRALWAARSVAGLVLCDRADGAWRSDDDGITWERVRGLPAAHSFADLPGVSGGVLAGTVGGLRTSLDMGRSWVEVDDPLSGIAVYGFADDGERLWAGTAEGLFVSSKVVGWAKMVPRRDSDMPVWTLANDPFWRGGLWLAGPVGILRTDDGGENLRPAGRNPLMGTAVLLALEGAGHVLAAGVDGVWESLDGGIVWRPLARGLPHPRVESLVTTPRGILSAGAEGVFVLRRADPSAVEDMAEVTKTLANEPPMGELVEVALRRPGLAIASVLGGQNLVAGLLLPKLTITGRTDRLRHITADHQALSNDGGARRGWFVGATACFGNCGTSVSFADTDVVALADEYGVDVQGLPELTVVGDEVYVADSAGALAPVAANVAERMTQYRSEVANRVSELSLARRRLVEARADVRVLSLKDQAAHELRILEAAARLDVYTNGYFTRVLEGR